MAQNLVAYRGYDANVVLKAVIPPKKNRREQRDYGRALRGEKVYGEVSGRKFERVSIVAGQNGRDILSPLQLPVTPEGAVIIMDNASFHRKKQLNKLAAEKGRQIIFLPPYSPELNLIEHFWN